jgi:hypothetical protein
VIVAAFFVGAGSVLAGWAAESAGWDVLLIACGVAWALSAFAFVAAVVLTSRRAGRPMWRVVYDAFRSLLRFMVEVG